MEIRKITVIFINTNRLLCIMQMKYDDLIKLSIQEVETFLEAHPGHIGAENAIRTLKHDQEHEARLKRMGKKTASVNGSTKNRYSASMNRVPPKRELR